MNIGTVFVVCLIWFFPFFRCIFLIVKFFFCFQKNSVSFLTLVVKQGAKKTEIDTLYVHKESLPILLNFDIFSLILHPISFFSFFFFLSIINSQNRRRSSLYPMQQFLDYVERYQFSNKFIVKMMVIENKVCIWCLRTYPNLYWIYIMTNKAFCFLYVDRDTMKLYRIDN